MLVWNGEYGFDPSPSRSKSPDEAFQRSEPGRAASQSQSLKSNSWPLSLTSWTTSPAFFSSNLIGAPPSAAATSGPLVDGRTFAVGARFTVTVVSGSVVVIESTVPTTPGAPFQGATDAPL